MSPAVLDGLCHADRFDRSHPDDECQTCERCSHWHCEHHDATDACHGRNCDCAAFVTADDVDAAFDARYQPVHGDGPHSPFVKCLDCSGRHASWVIARVEVAEHEASLHEDNPYDKALLAGAA